jgi:DNA-nicking Smr family endonuclease
MDDEPHDPSFRTAMGDVSPLATKSRDRSRSRAEPTAEQLMRRARAQADVAAPTEEILTLGDVPSVGPHDVLSWKIDGVQEGVFRNLRQGRYPIEGALDLHRHTVAQAREAVMAFLAKAHVQGWRSVLITHGRGERSPTPARIKSYVAHWMIQWPDVIAFHSAERRHGGAGALYVLLRKSRAAREDNRERYGQKSDF